MNVVRSLSTGYFTLEGKTVLWAAKRITECGAKKLSRVIGHDRKSTAEFNRVNEEKYSFRKIRRQLQLK